MTTTIVIEHNLGYTYDWPEGVPHNYDELFRDWGAYIAKTVARFNKVHRNYEDLVQDIWLRLMNAQFLERFVDSAAARLPKEMTAEEACTYLGVTWKQWECLMRRNHADADKWAPTPVGYRGEGVHPIKEGVFPLLSKLTVFKTGEIQALHEVDPWRNRPNERKRPTITARGFRAYLTQAVRNHFANFCRTRNRKYKECLLAPTAVMVTDLGQPAAGYHRSKADVDAIGGWETNIVALMLGDEEALSIKHEVERQFSKRGVDPTSGTGQEVLDYIVYSSSFDAKGLKPQDERRAIDALFTEAFKAQEKAAARAHFREHRRQKVLLKGGPKLTIDAD